MNEENEENNFNKKDKIKKYFLEYCMQDNQCSTEIR